MDTDTRPVINNWYQHPDGNPYFSIIDIDEQNGLLDIQHANGDLDTLDIDEWYRTGYKPVVMPEQWDFSDVDDEIDDSLQDQELSWSTWPEQDPLAVSNIHDSDDHPLAETRPDALDERLMLDEWSTVDEADNSLLSANEPRRR